LRIFHGVPAYGTVFFVVEFILSTRQRYTVRKIIMPQSTHDQPATGAVVYTVPEFCAAYRISRTLAYGEISAGRLGTVKVGRRRLVPVAAAKKWLAGLAA
jgi:hypothetical protein